MDQALCTLFETRTRTLTCLHLRARVTDFLSIANPIMRISATPRKRISPVVRRNPAEMEKKIELETLSLGIPLRSVNLFTMQKAK